MITKINTYTYNHNLSFKSSLDTEKSVLKNKLAKLKEDAITYKNLKTTEINDFNIKNQAMDNKICSARSEVDTTKQKISSTQKAIKQINEKIEAERGITSDLDAQINANNEKIQKLQEKQKSIFQENLRRTEILEEECAKKFSTEAVYLSKVYEDNFIKSKNCTKQQIIETLINPTIELMDGGDNNLPSFILFENNNDVENCLAMFSDYMIG